MADIVYCEFLKLKRSKICLIAFLGTLVTPLFVLILALKNKLSGIEIPLFGLYDSAFVFLMPLFAPLTFSIVTAYLFSREYTEKTLKTIFIASVSREKFLIGKFIALFFCIIFLMVLTWAEILVLAIIFNIIFGIRGLNFVGAIYFLFQMLYGGILLYAVITPVAYFSIRSKGFFAPVLISAVIALSDVILTGSPIAAYFPWTITYLLVIGSITRAGGNYLIAYLIIGIVCFISIWGSINYFKKTDIL